jgi:zinc ribbon protein
MKPARRSSLLRAVTLPLSILLFWQAFGWIAFGLLEPGISRSVGSPENANLVLTVGIAMAIVAATLGLFFLYYHAATSQGDFVPHGKTVHKCLNCGHTIPSDASTCPYCGSRTLF